jgi:hypothetical protein
VPDALTVNVTDDPIGTVRLAGCVVIDGAPPPLKSTR